MSSLNISSVCTEEQERQTGDTLLAQGDPSGAQKHYEAALASARR